MDNVVSRIQEQAREARESASVLGTVEDLDPGEAQRLMAHPLPYWVERMTVSYLRANGGRAEKKQRVWDLIWPDGETLSNVVFTGKDADEIAGARHLTLEDARVRRIAMLLPRVAEGQPIPSVVLPGLASEVSGFWALWSISIYTDDWNRRRIMTLFLHDDGRLLMPTARYIWDQLLTTLPKIQGHLGEGDARKAFNRILAVAEAQGRVIYDELLQAHAERLTREREKGENAFAVRRRAVERIGLPAVRNHRFALLEREERTWREQLEQKGQVIPELTPLLLIRLDEGDGHG